MDGLSLTSTRRFAAKPAAIWAAYADPQRLAQWWGPNGFRNTFNSFDFRPGGTWTYVMHGPDGGDFDGHRTFLELSEPERIVMRHTGSMHDFLMTVILEEASNGTDMTWVLDFDPDPDTFKIKDIILAANEENFDRLADHLAAAK
jgi:uncharacterized protein YndB with AHSA1/START domain